MRKKKEEFIFNPIAQLFSMFMRWERAALGLDHREMGEKLHMSEAMVRMIEGGRAILHPSKIFALKETCKKNVDLKFGMVSKMISGYHYVQALMDNGMAPQEAFQELARKDTAFDVLYRSVHHFFNFIHLSEEQQAYIMNSSPYFTQQFLCDDYYGTAEGTDRFELLVKNGLTNLSTLEADTFLKTVESKPAHAALPVLYSSELLAPYQARIQTMTAIYRYPQRLIEKDHYKKIPYNFLTAKNFQFMRILFLNLDQKANEVSEVFFDKLQVAQPELSITNAVKKKVEFRALSDLDYRNLAEKALLMNAAGYKTLNAFWSFQLDTGNQLGFASASEGNHEYIYNLNYPETKERSQNLYYAWNETNVPWKKRGTQLGKANK